MNNPIRNILHDMDMEFTSTIPMEDEQIEEVYRRYAKIVKGAVVDSLIEKLKSQADRSLLNPRGYCVSLYDIDRIYQEAIREGEING